MQIPEEESANDPYDYGHTKPWRNVFHEPIPGTERDHRAGCSAAPKESRMAAPITTMRVPLITGADQRAKMRLSKATPQLDSPIHHKHRDPSRVL